jgi:hypothetical protein
VDTEIAERMGQTTLTDIARNPPVRFGQANIVRSIAIATTVVGFFIAWGLGAGAIPTSIGAGFDASIWYHVDPTSPYLLRAYAAGNGGFFYSPAFAQLVSLLHPLPWQLFRAVWALGMALCLTWMLGPFTLIAVLLQPIYLELLAGNVNLFIGAAIVAGFRYPALWSLIVLTKVAPGIGLLWFAMRREWRKLVIAIASTAAIVGVSYILAPALWYDWIWLLAFNQGAIPELAAVQIPLLVRLPFAMIALTFGAMTNRRHFVPLAALLATPVLWNAALLVPVASVWLRQRSVESPDLSRV